MPDTSPDSPAKRHGLGINDPSSGHRRWRQCLTVGWCGNYQRHLLPSLLSNEHGEGHIKVVLRTPIGRPTLLALATCFSVAALLAGCGGETSGTESPTTQPISTPTVATTSEEAQQPEPTAVPTTPPTQMALEVGHKAGQKAPDFMLTTVDGEQVSLDSFSGRPLLLYFYTTW